MLTVIKRILLLVLLVPSLVFAELSATVEKAPQTNIEKRAEQFRSALQYWLPVFINIAQLTFDRDHVLTKDLVDLLQQLKSNSAPYSNNDAKLTSVTHVNAKNPAIYSKEFAKTATAPLSKDLSNISAKDGIYHPNNTQEIQQIINAARSNHYKVRTIGAAHSPKEAIYDAQNSKEIRVILDGDLRKITSLQPDSSGDFAIVTVGAGCNLGVNPADPASTLANSFNYQVDKAGYALPTLGGISHQTVAGFLQTSSSGGTAQHAIADSIEAIEWVDGNGIVHQAKRGDDQLNAVAVSMGLFGVITHVTFKLPKRYLVEGIETNNELNNSFLMKDGANHYTKLHEALFSTNEYIHINWLAQKYVGRTMEWTGKATTDTSLPIKPYVHTLSSKLMSCLATIVFKIGNLIDEGASNCDLLLRLKAELYKLFSNPAEKQEFRDVWYKALPIDDQADVDGAIDTAFSEFWFPEDQLDNVMQRLDQLLQENPKAAGNFIIEIYPAKQSPFWLSPSYGHHAFRVDLYWWKRNAGTADKYFNIFWEKLLDIPGARLHWGKYIPIPGKQYGSHSYSAMALLKNYPKYADWMKMREQMDPEQIFVTDYWRSILAIPAPKN